MLYRRGAIYWAKIRGRRFSLETQDERVARRISFQTAGGSRSGGNSPRRARGQHVYPRGEPGVVSRSVLRSSRKAPDETARVAQYKRTLGRVGATLRRVRAYYGEPLQGSAETGLRVTTRREAEARALGTDPRSAAFSSTRRTEACPEASPSMPLSAGPLSVCRGLERTRMCARCPGGRRETEFLFYPDRLRSWLRASETAVTVGLTRSSTSTMGEMICTGSRDCVAFRLLSRGRGEQRNARIPCRYSARNGSG